MDETNPVVTRTPKVVVVCAALTALLALVLSDDMLTPYVLGGREINHAARAMTVIAQLVVLFTASIPPGRQVALLLSVAFPAIALTALALNGLSALLFVGWGGRIDRQAAAMLGLLAAQAGMLTSGVRGLRQTRPVLHQPSQAAIAFGCVAAWLSVYGFLW